MLSSNASSSSKSSCGTTVAAAAAKGVVYSIFLRLLSFSLSQITMRLIEDPRTLGYSSIQLELLCSTTVLFLSREGFRLSLVRVAQTSTSTTMNMATSRVRGSRDEDDESKNEVEDYETEKCNQVNNVAWLTIPFGFLLTIISCLIHLHKCHTQSMSIAEDNDNHQQESNDADLFDYKLAGIYFSIATVIEIISEPCMIHCLRTFNVTTRAKAEGIASIGKALTTVLLLFLVQNSPKPEGGGGEGRGTIYIIFYQWIGPVSSFAISQIVYSIILCTILYQQTKHELYIPNLTNILRKRRLLHVQHLDQPTLYLSITFTIQSIFKHFLTEGDRIILSTLVSSYNSGIYAMVSSYGSIVSRMILLPLEENGRLLFSHHHGQLVATMKAFDQIILCPSKSESDVTYNNNNDEYKATDDDNDSHRIVSCLSVSIQQLEVTYITLVKLVLYVGLVFVSFGYNYTSIFLEILAGSKWGKNQQAYYTLSIYCSYILCMACNGMTEAFVYGVVDDSTDVGLLSVVHGLVGFVFYILAPLLVLHEDDVSGTIGLIFANEICMVLRSLYSMNFAAMYFYGKKEMLTQQRRDKQQIQTQSKDISGIKAIVSFPSLMKRCSLFFQLLKKVFPPQPVLMIFLLSFKITQYSKHHILENADGVVKALISLATVIHVGVGLLFLVLTMYIVFQYDKQFFGDLNKVVVPPTPTKSKLE